MITPRAVSLSPMLSYIFIVNLLLLTIINCASSEQNHIPSPLAPDSSALAKAREVGRLHSTLLNPDKSVRKARSVTEVPVARIAEFTKVVAPAFQQSCIECHGPDKQKGKFRIDTLDPDLIRGGDVARWLEVFDVLSNGEMPPQDAEVTLADADRSHIIDWLSEEIQTASQVRRGEQPHSAFRRMTRYEYNYALQDLLGLPFALADDLPPETASEDGFQNSSEMLQMSAMQFEYYRKIAHNALLKATVRGERPHQLSYHISIPDEVAKLQAQRDHERDEIEKQYKNDTQKKDDLLKKLLTPHLNRNNEHYINGETGDSYAVPEYRYGQKKQKYQPVSTETQIPVASPVIAVIPARKKMIFDLSDTLPDAGYMRVRIRAARTTQEGNEIPTLRLGFGAQSSNNAQILETVSQHDIAIMAPPGKPQFYQWEIPLSEIPRNPYRGILKIGSLPNPSEYIVLVNSSPTKNSSIQFDYLEITAPVNEQWPPQTHSAIFFDSNNKHREEIYARAILARFMKRAWRRPVLANEIERKVALFSTFRPGAESFDDAMIEVLATVLSSPHFLYVVHVDETTDSVSKAAISDSELANRLSMFLWSSIPDTELLHIAEQGTLKNPSVLISQTKRLLADTRAQRFSQHFVRQWLGLDQLDHVNFDKKIFNPHLYDDDFKDALKQEPIEFFNEVLRQNNSVMDFIHADYAMVNQRLATHYQIPDVFGPEFRRISLGANNKRGGLLTQAGVLAMNSDGTDSHPLRRGVWILKNILFDPPPPPPPNVPEVDLADPRILQMTLKERIEDHRNHPACYSCHAKIDPWGIAFEHFDAVGSWRSDIGTTPVDATSALFNKQQLNGTDGLKHFLLLNRQDQFARALVHKMTSYALGRSLTFSDRADIDTLTTAFRESDDRLGKLIELIVTSDLFLTK